MELGDLALRDRQVVQITPEARVVVHRLVCLRWRDRARPGDRLEQRDVHPGVVEVVQPAVHVPAPVVAQVRHPEVVPPGHRIKGLRLGERVQFVAVAVHPSAVPVLRAVRTRTHDRLVGLRLCLQEPAHVREHVDRLEAEVLRPEGVNVVPDLRRGTQLSERVVRDRGAQAVRHQAEARVRVLRTLVLDLLEDLELHVSPDLCGLVPKEAADDDVRNMAQEEAGAVPRHTGEPVEAVPVAQLALLRELAECGRLSIPASERLADESIVPDRDMLGVLLQLLLRPEVRVALGALHQLVPDLVRPLGAFEAPHAVDEEQGVLGHALLLAGDLAPTHACPTNPRGSVLVSRAWRGSVLREADRRARQPSTSDALPHRVPSPTLPRLQVREVVGLACPTDRVSAASVKAGAPNDGRRLRRSLRMRLCECMSGSTPLTDYSST